MKYTLEIDIHNTKAKALIDYISTLDFVKVNEEADTSIKSKEINSALDEVLHDIKKNGTTSHEAVMKKTKEKFPQLFK